VVHSCGEINAANDWLVLSNTPIANNQGQYSSGLGVFSQTQDPADVIFVDQV
jgi:hypothetical protein